MYLLREKREVGERRGVEMRLLAILKVISLVLSAITWKSTKIPAIFSISFCTVKSFEPPAPEPSETKSNSP
jgi:hypothetical protein